MRAALKLTIEKLKHSVISLLLFIKLVCSRPPLKVKGSIFNFSNVTNANLPCSLEIWQNSYIVFKSTKFPHYNSMAGWLNGYSMKVTMFYIL